jgi:hypothetical protein
VSGDRAGFNRARAQVRAAEGKLQNALGQLAKLGYKI